MRVYTTDRYYMRGRGGLYAADPDAYIRGRGIGSIFGRIFSSVVPIVRGALGIGSKIAKSKVGQELAKEVKKSATQAGVNVVSDALKGRNILQSSKEALSQASKNVGNKLEELTNPAPLRVEKRSRPPKPRPKKLKGPKKVSYRARLGGGGGGGKKNKKKCGKVSKGKKGGKKGARRALTSLFDE
jgi:hypothetical protein